MANKITVIKSDFSVMGQSLQYKKIVQVGERKFRIEIKRDSVDYQSNAIISVWSDVELKWNLVDSIFYTKMEAVKSADPYDRVPNKAAFEVDANNLLGVALEIVK